MTFPRINGLSLTRWRSQEEIHQWYKLPTDTYSSSMGWERPSPPTKRTASSTWTLAHVIKTHLRKLDGNQLLVMTMTSLATSLKLVLRSGSSTVSYSVARITILTRSTLLRCSPIRHSHHRGLFLQQMLKSYPPRRLWMIRSSVLTMTLLWEPLAITCMSWTVRWTSCMSIVSRISSGISVASLTWASSEDK